MEAENLHIFSEQCNYTGDWYVTGPGVHVEADDLSHARYITAALNTAYLLGRYETLRAGLESKEAVSQ